MNESTTRRNVCCACLENFVGLQKLFRLLEFLLLFRIVLWKIIRSGRVRSWSLNFWIQKKSVNSESDTEIIRREQFLYKLIKFTIYKKQQLKGNIRNNNTLIKMQQPLKRYTQCGNLTLMFAVFVILFSLSSTALTTFGINKPQNQPAAPTQARN